MKRHHRSSVALALLLASVAGVSTSTAMADQAEPGAAWSWGRGAEHQIGDGERTERHAPVAASGLANVAQISTFADHTLALTADGTAWAWGLGRNGRLGNGSTDDTDHPVQVSGLSGVTAVSAGAQHSLALTGDGAVWAWGYGNNGTLGNNSTRDSTVPVRVAGLPPAQAVAAGGSHSVVLGKDGSVWAWGGPGGGGRGTPARVSGLPTVVAIAAGGQFSLTLANDGSVWSWGDNALGELGDGSSATSRNAAAAISGLFGIASISANATSALAVSTSGDLWAWGANAHGQLGVETADRCAQGARCARHPVHVTDGALSAAAGDTFTLVLKRDHTVWGWGTNGSGELGNGSANGSDVTAPVQVAGLPTVRAVSAGHQHALAVATPLVSVNPAQVDFGQQFTGGTTATQSVSVTNDGSAPLNAPLNATGTLSGPDAAQFAIAGDTCSGTPVPAGGSCGISVAFSPTTIGVRTATLTITDNGLSGAHTVALTGEGLPPPTPSPSTDQAPQPATDQAPQPATDQPSDSGDDGEPA